MIPNAKVQKVTVLRKNMLLCVNRELIEKAGCFLFAFATIR